MMNGGLLWLLLSSAAFAQSIQISLVPQPVVEQRLRAYATKNADREPALRRVFEGAGCKGEALFEQEVKGGKQPNLVCKLPGSTDSTIVVGAHFDLVEKGDGVVDNWTGASLLASLYQGASEVPRRHTFVFVGFMGEELGLVGSQSFVKQLGKKPQNVKAMVNMDSLGLSDAEVWVTHADKELIRWLGVAAETIKVPIAAMNVDDVGSTDSESFRAKKIPAITIHSLTTATWPILHSPKDKIEAVHLEEYYRTYKLLAAYLMVLDQKLE